MTAALAASARSRRAPLRSVPRETTMQLITDEQRERLLANGRRTAAGENIDPPPVVKLFTPDANATWLLTELEPAEPERACGLCRAEARRVGKESVRSCMSRWSRYP